ncbi:hypothetical protein NPIL_660461 [Nephila pilipes]|uniref:Uncharacterized protein n=1 Tax=Nephila pilipes TaxID=299642 RepID=A0A8X6PF87_NEPPI|nr:hypothetical protein NPIL_660461 [Nephila pilipes]
MPQRNLCLDESGMNFAEGIVYVPQVERSLDHLVEFFLFATHWGIRNNVYRDPVAMPTAGSLTRPTTPGLMKELCHCRDILSRHVRHNGLSPSLSDNIRSTLGAT